MDGSVKRRVVLGTVIGGLVAGPFVISRFRKSAQVQLPDGGTVIWKAKADEDAVPSGWFSVVNELCVFQPLALPHQSVRDRSIKSVVFADKKGLLVSYSYGDDWKAALCYAPLNGFKPPETFYPLYEYPGQTLLTSIGCSGSQVSMMVRSCPPDADDETYCSEMLYSAPLKGRVANKNLTLGEPVLLMGKPNIGQVTKKHFRLGTKFDSHCWVAGKKILLYGCVFNEEQSGYGYSQCGIVAFDSSGRKQVVRQFGQFETAQGEPNKEDGTPARRRTGNIQSSKFYDLGNGTVQFIEGPYKMADYDPNKQNIYRDMFLTNPGSLVTMNTDGKVITEEPFPSLPVGSVAVLTKKHWVFYATNDQRTFYFAKREEPKEFTELRFGKAPGNGICVEVDGDRIEFSFDLLAVLPGGRHLLCSRSVVFGLDIAKKHSIPLGELGIIELPLSID